MEVFRGSGKERLRHRVRIAFAGEPQRRTLAQLGQAAVTAGLGAVPVLTNEVVLGTSAALAFLIRRKLGRTRLTVGTPQEQPDKRGRMGG